MKHFAKTDWVLFIKQQVSDSKRLEMENHLAVCQNCFEKYLDATERSIMFDNPDNPFLAIRHDFSERVMKRIRDENKLLEKKKAFTGRSNLMIYYTAVACLTLLFTANGIFNLLTSSIPRAAGQVLDISRQTEQFFVSGWIERLLRAEIDFDFKLELKFLDRGDNIGEKE